MLFRSGAEINLTEYEKRLVKLGYERCAQAESPGQFAVRGGIVDVFPFTEETPYRMELWGDEIDSIKSYDAQSQRSIENVDAVSFYPATELIFSSGDIFSALKKIKADTDKQALLFEKEKKLTEAARIRNKYAELEERLMLDPEGVNGSMGIESYIGYLADYTVSFAEYFSPSDTTFVLDEPGRIAERLKAVQYEFGESMSHRLEKGDILPKQTDVLYDTSYVYGKLYKGSLLALSVLDTRAEGLNIGGRYDIGAKGISSYNNSFETLVGDVRRYKKEGYVTILASSSRIRAERLAADLRENDVTAFFSDRYDSSQLDYGVLADIADECAEEIKAATDDTTTRMLYRLTGNSNYLYQDNNEWVDSLRLNQVIFMSGHGDGSSQYENIILYVFEVTVANNYYSENGYFIFEYTNAIRNGSGEFMIGRNNPELRYVCGQDFDSLYNDVMQNTQVQYNSELLEGINPEGNTQ